MITYSDIYDAARRERNSERLQPIAKNFISEVSNYLKDKNKMVEDEKDAFSENIIKLKKQIENAITLFKELMNKRRKKILNLVLIASETGISKQDFEYMFNLEKTLFENLMKCIEKSDKELNEKLYGDFEEDSQKNELIIFSEEVGEIAGLDGNFLGPFSQGECANLPKEIAKIFIEENKASPIYRE